MKTTLYSEHYRSTQFFNLPILGIERSADRLVFKGDDILADDVLVVQLPALTEIDDHHDLIRNARGFTLTMVYAKAPGYFQFLFTNRFETRSIDVCTPGYTLNVEYDAHRPQNHDVTRYRRDGVMRYDYSDLFAASITQWPANRYLRTVITHPWWTWVIDKDADGEDLMRLCMRNPAPADDDENYITCEVTEASWARARENYLICQRFMQDTPRNNVDLSEQYAEVVWLGWCGDLDLYLCDNRFIAAAMARNTVQHAVCQLDAFSPEWMHTAVRRVRALHPGHDHLPFP